jgi:hypothetical protein
VAVGIKSGISACVVVLAIAVGVRLGLAGPTISPVSPPAVAARQANVGAPLAQRPDVVGARQRPSRQGRARG